MTKKILFFTPSFRRTGSEIVLYNLINNIDTENFKPIGIISRIGGELLSQVHNNILTTSFEEGYDKVISLIELAKIKLLNQKLYQQFLIKLHHHLKPDIWYINTITQPDVLYAAQSLNIPCIVHSHELEQMLMGLTEEYVQKLVSYPHLIIACSNSAKKVLTTLGRKQNIEVCYPSIDTTLINKYTKHDLKAKFREKYSLPQDAFIWSMSGITDVNKNPIRFIELAKKIISQYPNAYFMWLGCDLKSAMYIYLKQYCKQLDMFEKIRWISNLEQVIYYEYLTTIDAFILTSNRESFSLALIEAMYMKKPTISLNCGGPSEIITNNTGMIIDSWDNDNIVQAMIKVMNKDFNYSEICAQNQANIFSLSNQSLQWNNLLKNYF